MNTKTEKAKRLVDALENLGPHMAQDRNLNPGHVDQSVPEGMAHVRRITPEEAGKDPFFAAIPKGDARPQFGPKFINSETPIGKPGYFRMKNGPVKRLKVIVEAEGFENGRRISRQRTAFFEKVNGIRTIYKYENPVHCANLRCNEEIEEVHS